MAKYSVDEIKNIQILKRLIPFLRPNSGWIIIGVLIRIIIGVLAVFSANAMKNLVDSALTKSTGNIWLNLAYILTIMLFNIPANMLYTYCAKKFSQETLYKIRKHSVECLTTASMHYIEKEKKGNLVSRYANDVNMIQGFIEDSLIQFIILPIEFLISFIYLMRINWHLTLVILIPVPVIMLVIAKLSKFIGKYIKDQREAFAMSNSVALEGITGLSVVKAYKMQDVMDKKYCESVDLTVQKGLNLAKPQALVVPLGYVMEFSPMVMTFTYGGYLIIKQIISLGSLYAYLALLDRIITPIRKLTAVINKFNEGTAACTRVFEAWDMPKDIGGEIKHSAQNCKEAIKISDLTFSYDGINNIFENFNLEIKIGEKVAIVGPSGCGKSTLLKLITGFYPTYSGEIKVYGHEIKKWHNDSLRALMSVVSQDAFLFPGSIFSNISYGKENASVDDIINAAKAANIHDFIQKDAPNAYDTVIGEWGSNLSGGQKQRLSIARSILKDAPLLLMDEPTAALDNESESEVQKAFDELMQSKTVFIIAHRLSTIKNAERIIVINAGKIEESGTHKQLLNKNGLYSRLYQDEQLGLK